MEVKTCISKIEWDSFVKESPQGNIYCTTGFLDAIPDNYELILLEDRENILLGAVILKNEVEEILKAPYPFTIFQGVLCCRAFQEMPFHKQSSWLLKNVTILLTEMEKRFNRISFCLSHTFEDLRGFQWFHYTEPNIGMFKIDLKYTGILDLSSISDIETYLTTVRAVRRQEYRKALKEDFFVERTTNIEILNRLHAMTFERQGIFRTKEEEELLLNISKAALDKGFGELLVCNDKNGNAASASLFLFDKHYGYYHFGASNPDYRKSGASTLLIMENIRGCIDKKLLGVDFVGVNSPNRGDFKTSFNAQAVKYFNVTWEKPKNEAPKEL